MKMTKEKEKKERETILRKKTIQLREASDVEALKPRYRSKLFKSKSKKPEHHLSQLASYMTLASKRKIEKKDTVEPAPVNELLAEPVPFDRQLHEYIDSEIDKMLLKGFEKLSINLDSEFSKALFTNPGDELLQDDRKHVKVQAREPKETYHQEEQIYDSSIKGRKIFKQDLDIQLEQVQIRKMSSGLE